MNLKRRRSDMLTNRTLPSTLSLNEMSISTSDTDGFSLKSFSINSRTPSAHVSVSRITMIEREGTIGNARIQPPTRQIIDKENDLPHRRRGNTSVIVSRIRSSSHRKKISPISALSIDTTSDINKDHVRVNRVHSLSSKMAFSDTADAEMITPIRKENDRMVSPVSAIESEPVSKSNRRGITFERLRSKSSRISTENSIHVERIPRHKRQIQRRYSTRLSPINAETQKNTISQHTTVHVKRLSRTETV